MMNGILKSLSFFSIEDLQKYRKVGIVHCFHYCIFIQFSINNVIFIKWLNFFSIMIINKGHSNVHSSRYIFRVSDRYISYENIGWNFPHNHKANDPTLGDQHYLRKKSVLLNLLQRSYKINSAYSLLRDRDARDWKIFERLS